MRFLNRALLGLFLLAVTIGLLGLAGGSVWQALQASWSDEGGSRPARERVFSAEVLTVTPSQATPVLTAFGEIRSRRTLELRAPAGGTVIELAAGFEDGGAVEAGQLLLRIDPAEAQSSRDTAAADLREAQANFAEAERALVLAREDVAAAATQADLRRRAFERQQDLAERGVGSAAAVETAELAAASADQAVLSRRQALAQAEASVDQTSLSVERRAIALADAERRLADTELRAEFAGVLSDVNVVQGRLVNANEQIAQLLDPEALEVAFRVSTAQYARILSDQGRLPDVPVSVMLDVFGLDLAAPARLVRESGSVAEGQSGRLLFAQLQETRGFRVGDFVTVGLEEAPLRGVAVLPATALSSDSRVLVLGEENRLEEVAVELLRRQGDDVIIRGPEVYGQEIVAARTPVLGAGIRIEPLRPTPDGADAEVTEPETIALEPERRARLIAFVESNGFIPADVKERLINQLSQDEVPARVVARIEDRMGS